MKLSFKHTLLGIIVLGSIAQQAFIVNAFDETAQKGPRFHGLSNDDKKTHHSQLPIERIVYTGLGEFLVPIRCYNGKTKFVSLAGYPYKNTTQPRFPGIFNDGKTIYNPKKEKTDQAVRDLSGYLGQLGHSSRQPFSFRTELKEVVRAAFSKYVEPFGTSFLYAFLKNYKKTIFNDFNSSSN